MFKISNKKNFVILILMLVASGCTATPTNVTVGELSPATVETIQESVILSNCGGTAEISQYAERSSQISVEGAGQSAFLMNVIKNSIESKYENTTSARQGIELVAAPGSKIEYVIEWTLRNQTGIATVETSSAQFYYRYTVPEKVELISSQSFECSQVIPTPTQIVIQPVSFLTKNESDNESRNKTVSHSAKLYVASTNLGSLTLEYPREISIGESKMVLLSIVTEPSLSNLPHTIVTKTGNSPSAGYAMQIDSQIQLFPSIVAELRNTNFDKITDGYPEKLVVPNMSMEWTWNITPKVEGKQTLIVQLEVPVILNDGQETHLIETIPFDILVSKASPMSMLSQNIINNFAAIITAIIGLAGALVGVYFTYKASKKNANDSIVGTEKQTRTRKKNPSK